MTPAFSLWGTAEGPKGDFDISLQAGTTGLQYRASEPIIKGKYFTQNDYDSGVNACVITEASAIALFGTTDVIGMTFDATFYGVTQEMRIVGIRQDSASSLINMGSGMDKMVTAEAPLTLVGNKYGFYIDDTEEFYVMADSTENSVEVAGEVLNLMETRHNVRGENQIMMQSFTDVSVFSLVFLVEGWSALLQGLHLL